MFNNGNVCENNFKEWKRSQSLMDVNEKKTLKDKYFDKSMVNKE